MGHCVGHHFLVFSWYSGNVSTRVVVPRLQLQVNKNCPPPPNPTQQQPSACVGGWSPQPSWPIFCPLLLRPVGRAGAVAPMPARGSRQSVCGAGAVKGGQSTCQVHPVRDRLGWAGAWGGAGQGCRVSKWEERRVKGRGVKGEAGEVGVKGLLSNRCAGARQVRSGGTAC